MKAAIAIVLSLMLVLSVPFDSVASQDRRPPVVPVHPIQCDVCDAHGLSKAVVFGTFGNLRHLQAKLKKGEARSADVQAATASVKILFAHFDETGITRSVEQAILAREEDFLKYSATRSDAEHIQKQHAALGVHITVEEQLRELEASTVNDRMGAIGYIKEGGLHAYYAQVISRLEAMGDRMAKAEKGGSGLKIVAARKCDYAIVAGFFGIGCAFGCAGCCVVAAFSALFAALEC